MALSIDEKRERVLLASSRARAAKRLRLLVALALAAALAACGTAAPTAPASTADSSAATAQQISIATTTLVGDTVRRVAGDGVALTVLLPPGMDPHNYEPTPQDIATITEADAVFANGLGYEAFLTRLLENVGGAPTVVEVSEGIAALNSEPGGAVDPHVWFNPLNVAQWARTIAQTLGELDPANAATYQANAEAYEVELKQLDEALQAQFAQIPAERRVLITDHDTFGYLADHYGFELVGAVIPSASSTAEPSAQELAALQTAVKAHNVPAIFVANEVSANTARRIAEDTGITLVRVYVESLSDANGPAATYIDFMRYNANAITEALK